MEEQRQRIAADMRGCWRSMFLIYWVLIDNFMWKRSKKTLKTRHGVPQIPLPKAPSCEDRQSFMASEVEQDAGI